MQKWWTCRCQLNYWPLKRSSISRSLWFLYGYSVCSGFKWTKNKIDVDHHLDIKKFCRIFHTNDCSSFFLLLKPGTDYSARTQHSVAFIGLWFWWVSSPCAHDLILFSSFISISHLVWWRVSPRVSLVFVGVAAKSVFCLLLLLLVWMILLPSATKQTEILVLSLDEPGIHCCRARSLGSCIGVTWVSFLDIICVVHLENAGLTSVLDDSAEGNRKKTAAAKRFDDGTERRKKKK